MSIVFKNDLIDVNWKEMKEVLEDIAFYKKLGFQEQGIGLAIVKGDWLKNESAAFDLTH